MSRTTFRLYAVCPPCREVSVTVPVRCGLALLTSRTCQSLRPVYRTLIARSAEWDAARNQIFNVGADKPYSVNDLARIVARAMGVKPDLKHLEARREVVHAFSDHSRVARFCQYSSCSADRPG